MTRRILLSVVCAVCLPTAATTTRSASVVEILRHGHFYAAPATLYLTVAVEPNPNNRVLRVEADGDDLYRSSEVTLDGADSARLHTVSFRALPPGTYLLRALVISKTAVLGTAEDEIVVNEGGAPR